MQSPHLFLLHPCPLKLEEEEEGGTGTFLYGKSQGFFSQSFETICRAEMWPLTRLCITCPCEFECECNRAALPHPLPPRAAVLWVLTSLFPDSSTAHYHQSAQHTFSPFAFEDCICYFRLEVWVICVKCAGFSSSINVREKAVSLQNLSHFHSQNATGTAVPLLNNF